MRRFFSFTRVLDSKILVTICIADEDFYCMEIEVSFFLDGVSDLTGLNEQFVCLSEDTWYAI